MISVVIPLYNKEKQIKRTLQSILAQTFQDFEIVIVNDGSIDNSIIEVEKVKDQCGFGNISVCNDRMWRK